MVNPWLKTFDGGGFRIAQSKKALGRCHEGQPRYAAMLPAASRIRGERAAATRLTRPAAPQTSKDTVSSSRHCCPARAWRSASRGGNQRHHGIGGFAVEIDARVIMQQHAAKIATRICGACGLHGEPKRAVAPAHARPDSTAAPGQRSRWARGPRGWRQRTRDPAIRFRSSTRRPWRRRSFLPCR